MDEWELSAILQDSFIEDTTKLLLIEKSNNFILDIIKTEALKTLTSIVSLDRPCKFVISFVMVQVLRFCEGDDSLHALDLVLLSIVLVRTRVMGLWLVWLEYA